MLAATDRPVHTYIQSCVTMTGPWPCMAPGRWASPQLRTAACRPALSLAARLSRCTSQDSGQMQSGAVVAANWVFELLQTDIPESLRGGNLVPMHLPIHEAVPVQGPGLPSRLREGVEHSREHTGGSPFPGQRTGVCTDGLHQTNRPSLHWHPPPPNAARRLRVGRQGYMTG